MHHDQAQGQRHQRGQHEPAQRLDPDAADRGGILHMGDAHNQGREHQGRDDHPDQAQENVGDDGQVCGGGFGALRRQVGVDQEPGQDAQDHRSDDQGWKKTLQNNHLGLLPGHDSIGRSVSPSLAAAHHRISPKVRKTALLQRPFLTHPCQVDSRAGVLQNSGDLRFVGFSRN